MAQFLQLPATDPTLHRSPDEEATYEAQCWWMAHLTLLDGVLDKVMPAYLQRLLVGESQKEAYAATFGRPYEELDKYFRKLRDKLVLRQYTGAMPDAAALGAPQLQTDAQVQSRLAELLLVHEPASASGAQFASDVLTADPKNERAQLAFARHEFAVRRYAPVLESLQRLGTLEDLTAASHRDMAALQSNLAKDRDENMPGASAVDSKAMRAAARANFRRAMEMEPNDPRAPYELGWLMFASCCPRWRRPFTAALKAWSSPSCWCACTRLRATPPTYSSTPWLNSAWPPPKPSGHAPRRALNDCAHN
jgi:hypothetical protein